MLIADLNINFMDIKNKQKSDFNGGNIIYMYSDPRNNKFQSFTT